MLSDTTPQSNLSSPLTLRANEQGSKRLAAFLVAAFLVSVPVFIQAPLVRLYPWVSLFITPVLFLSGLYMYRQSSLKFWGDLTIGFSWTWLAGSLYWGWLRYNPYIHLPVEAIGLPIVLILISRNHLKIGSYFYLGSLLGTAITDIYFYWVDLIPYWKQVMSIEPALTGTVLQAALEQIHNPIAAIRALWLLSLLVAIGLLGIRSKNDHWWAFSGAVLSTILVDALFFIAATLA
ncbi:MAG: DUF3120 domain-containing protein [Leptolyngbya sp. SIO3F4]|nr:DUF3120 domain-containing protein [Leptolyngbya sp. SIO3F4]